MSFADLRSFLQAIAELPGELVTVTEPVDPRFEISGVLRAAGDPAVLFTAPAGYPGAQVAGNVLGTRSRAALLLGAEPARLKQTFSAARRRAVAPRRGGDGPVKEERHTVDFDLTAQLPVPTFHAEDAGPFLTAGVVIAKDPATGRQNCGIHRMQVKGPHRLSLFLANPPLADFFAAAESAGQPLPVAVALGAHPAVLLGAVSRAAARDQDKLEIAGGLRGEPVTLVPAETNDLWVPADAEIVIEGRVLPGVREDEGPFGESTGYYFACASPVVEVTAITHRSRPILQVIQPWGGEIDVLFLLAQASDMLQNLQSMAPAVVDLNLVPGTCSFHAIIAVAGAAPAEVRRIMGLALHLDRRVKQVTVVGADVDIYDLREVLWALATRFRPEQDILVVTGLEGYAIDPSAPPGGTIGRVAFDATCPQAAAQSFTKIQVPPAALARAAAILQRTRTDRREN